MTARTITFTAVSSSTPSWATGAVGEWRTLGAGSQISSVMPTNQSGTLIYSYSGGALDSTNSRYYFVGGGHADYSGNEVYSIDLLTENPVWTRRSEPTPAGLGAGNIGYNTNIRGYPYDAAGRPISRHTWLGNVQWCPTRGTQGQLMLFGATAVWGNGNGTYATIDAWDPTLATNATNRGYTWVNPAPAVDPNVSTTAVTNNGPNPNFALFPLAMGDVAYVRDKRGDIWGCKQSSGGLYKWAAATATWSSQIRYNHFNFAYPLVYDSLRDRVVQIPDSAIPNSGFWVDCQNTTTQSAWGWPSSAPSGIASGSAVWYEPDRDRYIFSPYGTTDLYEIHPTTWAVTQIPTTNNFTWAGDAGVQQKLTRFCYVPSLKGCIFFYSSGAPAKFVRTA